MYAHQRTGRTGWYAEVEFQGRRLRRRAGETKAQAEHKGRAIEALAQSGMTLEDAIDAVLPKAGAPRPASAHAITFEAAVEPYLKSAARRLKASTTKARRMKLNHIARTAAWAKRPLRSLQAAQVAVWLEARADEGLAGSTTNYDLSAISALLGWAVRLGHLDSNPLKGGMIRRRKVRSRDRLWTHAERDQVLDACPNPEARDIVEFLTLTGMRRGEAARLEPRDLDHAERTAYVRPESAKGGKGRIVPLTARAYAIVRRQRVVGATTVFRTARGNPWNDDSFDKVIRHHLRPQLPDLFPPNDGLHLTRHFFISYAVSAGVSPAIVAQIVGQSSARITAIYSHRVPGAHREAIDQIGKAL